MESSSKCPESTGLLQDRLIGLAGTADENSGIPIDLIVVAQLVARIIVVVNTASVTARHEDGYVTVAASSDFAVLVDQAQYDDKAGPCLEALDASYPAVVPEIAATITWPGFRDAAARLGLRSSLSIPLFAGSGTTIATLNLYSRQVNVLSPLVNAVWAAYDPTMTDGWKHHALDAGSRELASGIIGATALRSMIQTAINVLASVDERGTHRACRALCDQAAESGSSLTEAAASVIEQLAA